MSNSSNSTNSNRDKGREPVYVNVYDMVSQLIILIILN